MGMTGFPTILGSDISMFIKKSMEDTSDVSFPLHYMFLIQYISFYCTFLRNPETFTFSMWMYTEAT